MAVSIYDSLDDELDEKQRRIEELEEQVVADSARREMERLLEEASVRRVRPSAQRGTRRQTKWKAGSKFGAARDLGVFRSHDRSLKNEYYRNRRGQRYFGSVCDSCERDGKSHFHHPLRCFVQHPGWWQPGNAPEEKGVTTWYVRGGGTASISSSRRRCRGMEGDEQVSGGNGEKLQTEADMVADEESEKENGDEETIDDGEQVEEEEVLEDAEEMAEQM